MPTPPAHRLSPRLALALGIVTTSCAALLVRLADAPALAIAFWRCALATLVLLALGGRACRRELPRLAPRERLLALASGLALALHFGGWTAALGFTTVASTVVLANTTPLWVALLTPFLSHDRLRAGTLLAVVLSVLGGSVIGIGDLELEGDALVGDALALGAAAALSLYLLAGRRLRTRLSLVPYLVACYGSAAGFLLAFALMAGQPVLGFGATTWAWLLLLALVPQLLGHSSFNYALGFVSAAVVAVAGLGEVLGAPLLAWLFLAEVPPALVLAGGTLVLVGVVLAIRSERPAG